MTLQALNAASLDATAVVAALLSGGDRRIALDPQTGLNGYWTPPDPAPHLVCASSCTGSPIAPNSFQRAASVYQAIDGAASANQRRLKLAEHGHAMEAWLVAYFGVADLAHAIICPSGTDALLTTALLLAGESPGTPITAILPVRSETGTGVPLAAACRRFEAGESMGAPCSDADINTVEVPLRDATGAPRPDDTVNAAFKAVVDAAPGRAIVYLTYSSKTGLIAPVEPPAGADVIVDACQSRIDPALIATFLRRGWPVVVTGSKFFGGPAFSGAVLFPRARERADMPPERVVNLGTVLRWTAAREVMQAAAEHKGGQADFIRRRAAAIDQRVDASPLLAPIAGLQQRGSHWSDGPSIVTFAVRDPANDDRMLTAAALRPIYQRVARAGVLLGQPVDLGPFGGLRIAIGARDLLAGDPDCGLTRTFAAIEDAIMPAARPSSSWQPGLPMQRPAARVG